MQLTERIKTKALELGFTFATIVPATPSEHSRYYKAWLEAGCHAEMVYLARPDAVARRADLSLTVPKAQSVVVLAANYHTQHLPPEIRNDPARGIIASYAWGLDYHDLLTPKLYQLQGWIESQIEGPVYSRAYVDTGPVLERELAVRGGLGFIGKNTCLINPGLGSYLFLGEIILDYRLPFDGPPEQGTCGRCTRCLAACPTNAFKRPYVLDSNLCLSYLTIELKGEIPANLRPLMGNRIFGCDICQEVCPYNKRFAIPTAEPAFRAALDKMAPPLLDLISLDEAGFRGRFKGSPLKRAKRRGLLRNVCVALGNWGNRQAIPALQKVRHDSEPLVRSHAEWALEQIAGNHSLPSLEGRVGGG
jgi:epoxyqueuosine reductase